MKRELITKSERYNKSNNLTDRWLERKKKNKAIEDTVIFVKSKLSKGKCLGVKRKRTRDQSPKNKKISKKCSTQQWANLYLSC